MRLIKSKKNIICCIVIFIYVIFIEFPNLFLVGPIGIFGNSEILIKIISIYGEMTYMVPIDSNRLTEIFMQRIGNCADPCAQLARIYTDLWGFVLLVCIPILTNLYINEKIKNTKNMTEIIKTFFILTLYILGLVALLSVVPIICAYKLSILCSGGSAIEIIKYIGMWILPSIMVLITLEILIAFVTKERFGQILAYAVIVFPSLPSDVSSYPLYKLVIRFNGKSEVFYNEMYKNIIYNRICVMVAVPLSFLLIFLFIKKQNKTDYNCILSH